MKRDDILDIATDNDKTLDERFELMKDAIDDIERQFVEIRDLLGDFDFDNLDNITKARDLASEMANDLY